jgi:hypothetical protein
MTLIIIKIILAIVGAFLVFKTLIRWDPKLKAWSLIVPAVLAIVIAEITDHTNYLLSRPDVSIEITKHRDFMDIQIVAKKQYLNSLGIEVPLKGRMTEFVAMNAAVSSSVPAITASDNELVLKKTIPRVEDKEIITLNKAGIRFEGVNPPADLRYKIHFVPYDQSYTFHGDNIYKATYTWFHKGELRVEEFYTSLDTGKRVNKPKGKIEGAFIVKEKLTIDEMKAVMEKGPPKYK